MRVALIGVGHWHTPLYLDPVLALPDVTVVGVSDPAPAVAQAVAARAGCAGFTDYRALCERARPDFVFVLGRHDAMAETARWLIDRGIKFAIEKPCGISTAELDDLAGRARRAGAFAAVPFVFRQSGWLEAIRTRAAGEPVRHLAFTFVAGSMARYRAAGCDWMLARTSSGGGCLLNLGVHFVDLARLLLGPAPLELVGATLSNAVERLDVEDHAVVLLRAGAATCLIETGYTFPAPHMSFDLHFSIRTDRHYFVARDADALETFDLAQHRTVDAMPITNPPYYPPFVRDVLARASDGRPPVADLDDMAATLRLVEAAYALAPLARP
jgi:predicted dehydrogenase